MDDAPFPVPCGGVARGTVEAPPSKSHAIRLLIAGALCPRGAEVRRLGLADDVLHVLDAVHALGFPVSVRNARGRHFDADLAPTGGGFSARSAPPTLDLGGSGTGLRLITALCARGAGPFRLRGDETLQRRPVGSLTDALTSLGIEARALGPDGRPPVAIGGGVPCGGGRVAVDASRTSQGVSALLLLGAALPGGLVIAVDGPLVSAPYVALTIAVVERAGGTVVVRAAAGTREFEVHGPYGRLECDVEGDWSAAAYPLAAAVATGGDVAVRGLQLDSRQADRRVVDVLRAFGGDVEAGPDGLRASGRVRHPVEIDLSDAPDLGPLVGALACLAPGRSTVRGAPHMRIKECDRIAATVAAARSLGLVAEEHEDGFSIVGARPGELPDEVRGRVGGPVDSRGDHRMAMSFAVTGLVRPGVAITRPGCVAKTYPDFWGDLLGLLRGDPDGPGETGGPGGC